MTDLETLRQKIEKELIEAQDKVEKAQEHYKINYALYAKDPLTLLRQGVFKELDDLMIVWKDALIERDKVEVRMNSMGG